MTTTPETTVGADIIAGLREVADLIEGNPALIQALSATSPTVTLLAPVGFDVDLFRTLGDALGNPPLAIGDRWAEYTRTFGSIVKVQAYGARENLCDFAVVGTKTEEIREWRVKGDES